MTTIPMIFGHDICGNFFTAMRARFLGVCHTFGRADSSFERHGFTFVMSRSSRLCRRSFSVGFGSLCSTSFGNTRFAECLFLLWSIISKCFSSIPGRKIGCESSNSLVLSGSKFSFASFFGHAKSLNCSQHFDSTFALSHPEQQ